MTALQDNPINRYTIEDMPIDELQNFIEGLQKRRLQAFTIYQAAQEAKYEKALNATQALLDKRLDQFPKKLASVDKGIQDLEKYALDILSARMALGHDISIKQ